jgi:molybdate transport system ATP-binding protein
VTGSVDVALTKRFPTFTLEVAWTAAEGVVVLFGPSGSGKSLTLRCLAGLERPDGGRIVINGRTFFDTGTGVNLAPQARRLGYVFQGYALFPHLTVGQNVAFGLRGRPRSERRQRVAEVIARLGLDGLEHRAPRELSGGQQQRVALGRALAVDPELLLLDEPLSALDAPLRRQLRDDLERTLRDWRIPAVLVTHDLAEAYQLADRVIVYDHGRVIQASSKAEFLWQPSSSGCAIWCRVPSSRPCPTASSSAGAASSWRPSTRRRAPIYPRPGAPSRSSSARSTCASSGRTARPPTTATT